MLYCFWLFFNYDICSSLFTIFDVLFTSLNDFKDGHVVEAINQVANECTIFYLLYFSYGYLRDIYRCLKCYGWYIHASKSKRSTSPCHARVSCFYRTIALNLRSSSFIKMNCKVDFFLEVTFYETLPKETGPTRIEVVWIQSFSGCQTML